MSNYSDFTDTRRAQFGASVTYMDYVVQQVIDAFNDKKMLDNTVIVFASDNGGTHGGMG
jgi:arylsulfatase A-like enzyme